MATKSSVSTAKLQAVCSKLGMSVKVKSGSFKAFPANGSIKKSLDITTNKHGTTVQVLLVGFTMADGTVTHPKPPATTATQLLDMSVGEVLILRAFFKACKALVKMATSSQPKPATKEQIMNDSPAATPVVEEAVAAVA